MEYKLVRNIPVEDGWDLIVAGGGHAGTAAAVCAARLGAKVLLLEAMGCLGGMATSAYVGAFGPMADGERQLVRGFMDEVINAMYERKYLEASIKPEKWQKNYHVWNSYNPEGLKLVFDKFIEDAGVDVRFFTKVIDVVLGSDKHLEGLVITNVEGYKLVKAKAFIDATGDAVVASFAGAECREAYRDTKISMPASVTSLWANCDWESFYKQYPGGKGLQELLEQKVDEGFFSQWDKHFPGMRKIGKSTGYLNAGHVFKVNGLNCKDISKGMMHGRKIILEFEQFFKKFVPGFENMEIASSASVLGQRETRNIIGEAILTKEDFLAKRHFPDEIGVYNRFMDVHVYDTTPEEYARFVDYQKNYHLGPGNSLGLPYGILVPKGFDNLWVAGRCVSSDNQVLGTIRAQPCCSLLGQAAGTAAAQSLKTDQPAHSLDTDTLRKTLKANNVYLP